MSVYVEPHRAKPYGAILTVTPKPEPKPVSSFIPVNRGDLFNCLKWLRGEIYPGLVGHDLDDEGIAAWLCDNYIRYRQTMGDLDARHRVFADIQAVVQPPVVSPGPVPTLGNINGRLTVVDGRLANAAGFFNYQGMSAFCLIGHAMQGRRDEALRQIRRNARAGRNAQRVFAMLNADGKFGPVSRFTPDMAGWSDAAAFVIEESAALGVYTQINIFADCSEQFGSLYASHEDRRRVMRDVAKLRAYPSVWFRLANEPYQNGWSEADDPKLLELADELADILGHRDFAVGDVKDEGGESGSETYKSRVARVAGHCHVLVTHPDRAEGDGRERPIEHLKSVYEALDDVAGDRAIIFDEPRGFASARQPGKRDNRAAAAVAETCTAAILGCGYTYHHISEQDDATPGLEESRVALQIGTSSDYRYTNAGLGESWIGGFGGFYKVRTCSNGQIGWAVGHGPSSEPLSMAAAHGWGDKLAAEIESDGLVTQLRRGVRQ